MQWIMQNEGQHLMIYENQTKKASASTGAFCCVKKKIGQNLSHDFGENHERDIYRPTKMDSLYKPIPFCGKLSCIDF